MDAGARAADRAAASDTLSPRREPRDKLNRDGEGTRHARRIVVESGAMTRADALPEDIPGLRAAALALLAERDELLRRVDRMHHIIRQFQRAQFGRHSEKLDPDQLQLALEEGEIASAHKQATADKQMPAPRPRPEPGRRKSLPAHLPRIEVIIEPKTTSCPCCGSSMHVIGEEKSERLDVIPWAFSPRA